MEIGQTIVLPKPNLTFVSVAYPTPPNSNRQVDRGDPALRTVQGWTLSLPFPQVFVLTRPCLRAF